MMDACNAGAILADFSQFVVPEIWQEAREKNQGTDYVNSHPLMVILADKLMQLVHCKDVMDAYQVCREKANDNP